MKIVILAVLFLIGTTENSKADFGSASNAGVTAAALVAGGFNPIAGIAVIIASHGGRCAWREHGNHRGFAQVPPGVVRCTYRRTRSTQPNRQWRVVNSICSGARVGTGARPGTFRFNGSHHRWVPGNDSRRNMCWIGVCISGYLNVENGECIACRNPGDEATTDPVTGERLCVVLPIRDPRTSNIISNCRSDWVRWVTPDHQNLFCIPNCPITRMVTHDTSLMFNVFTRDGEPTGAAAGSAIVRYGHGNTWVEREFPIGTIVHCNNDTFEGDPYPGQRKRCYIGTRRMADEGGQFSVPQL